jgi:hypothetical protein
MQAEKGTADRAEDLPEALAATPATSFAGVAAKQDAVVREGAVWEDGPEFPWLQIRSALDDLARMSQQPMPDPSSPRGSTSPCLARAGASGCGMEPMEAQHEKACSATAGLNQEISPSGRDTEVDQSEPDILPLHGEPS